MVMGWVNFIESEAQKQVPGIRKKNNVIVFCRIRRHQIDQMKTKKLNPVKNSHITSALNLIT